MDSWAEFKELPTLRCKEGGMLLCLYHTYLFSGPRDFILFFLHSFKVRDYLSYDLKIPL